MTGELPKNCAALLNCGPVRAFKMGSSYQEGNDSRQPDARQLNPLLNPSFQFVPSCVSQLSWYLWWQQWYRLAVALAATAARTIANAFHADVVVFAGAVNAIAAVDLVVGAAGASASCLCPSCFAN